VQNIRCTKKLQKLLNLTESDIRSEDPAEGILGPWHANLVEIAESPAILYANDRTLLNFFIDINPNGPVHHFHKNVTAMVSCLRADLGLSDRIREQLLAEYAEISFAPTNNRRVLGSMNDLAFHYDYLVTEAGGIHSADIPRIIRDLNGMPMSMLAEGAPEDLDHRLEPRERDVEKGTLTIETALEDDRVKVRIPPQLVSEALMRDDHAGEQRSARGLLVKTSEDVVD
jgi:hypothetical protein